jgi:hypothetical protein
VRYAWVGPFLEGGVDAFVKAAHEPCFDASYQTTWVAGIFNKDLYRLCLDSRAEKAAAGAVLLSEPRLASDPGDPGSYLLQYQVRLLRGGALPDVKEHLSILCAGLAGGGGPDRKPVLERAADGAFLARTTVPTRLQPGALHPCRISLAYFHEEWRLSDWMFHPFPAPAGG